MTSAANLPDDIDALKAIILASQAKMSEQDGIIERKEDRIIRLEKLLADFKRALYGAKSEKGHPDQYHLALEDIETAMAVVHAEDEAVDPPKTTGTSKSRAERGVLPKHLPRIEEIIAPDVTCSCGMERHIIGEDVSERLDIVPAQFRVIVTRRPKYACRSCEAGVVQAPAKPRLIEGGMPTEATVASVIVSKYADHLPLYRQSQIYARQGVDIDRSTLAFWVGKAAHELKPVHDALLAHLKTSSKLFMDETPAPVLDPGRGKAKKGCFWALARDDRSWNGPEPPGVAFTYAPGRSGKHAVEILQGFEGILQVDGYAGYNRVLDLRDNQPIQLAYCWAHARRKLYELTHNNAAPIAEEGLKQIAALYRIETQARGASADERLAIRQQKSEPKIKAFKTWLDQARSQVSAKSPTGEALKYIAKYWDGLILFLGDGRIEMDSNPVERTIRPIALQRKNALFAGHDAGAANWAMLASLIETCKLNLIEPHSYLSGVLAAIVNGYKQKDIDQLLPWNYVR
ncbi:IS66 family transposase [Sulfitobacter geojensis]|uniref:IS66 family transposase n=1 Tax=Sulfitobacter geojensis TaxID=1342299 RepID=UPI0036D854C6